ncbi:organic cation/carnitine transporter 7 isoform X2 [Sesamum indicum]|uniref:Organic cation/carnitine transporter 7 isoform X2 n=1 Tax=Sesamum indicum TaxID=4182 RepID=A0A6I9UI28_SESIN|nr:organic cation/carnitine transporter 7 isoform X2 [Sesamum indicum]
MNRAVMNSGVMDYDRELVYTMDEALTMVGFGKFQALVLAYAGLGSMADAMELMILSFIGPSVRSEWGLSSRQESLITTVVFAGMLIGSYASGLISDNYGRRMGLLSIAAATSIFAVLSAFSPNYISLIIFRMVVGVGLGGGPVYSSWFLEFVPVRNRGVWMVVFATFSTIGTIFEASLAWIVMPRLGWRWLLALSSVPCLAAFILYFFTEESPRYLYAKGSIADAQHVLKKMATINETQLPSGVLVSDQISELDEELTTPEGTSLLSTIKNKNSSPKRGIFSFFTLLSSSLIKTTLLLWIVYLTNSFLYYGVVLMTSEFSSSQSKCGALVLHSKQPTDTSLYRNVFITSFAELPGLILSAILVDKVGRKISMVLMYSFGFISLLPLMFHQNELLTTSLLFGARMCFIGNFKIAGIYCPEIYPTSVRTTGAGVAAAVGKIGGMICPLVAVELVSGCHRMAAIASFEVVMVLSAICVLLFKVETKGMELHDTGCA